MSETLESRVLAELQRLGLSHEVVACLEEQADTAVFCEAHGYPVSMAANALVVATKKKPRRYACCIVKGDRRLDVNHRVRELLQGGRISFARPEEMREQTGMEVGGVTPFLLPEDMPIYFDAALLDEERIILGTGGRSAKVLIPPGELAALGCVTVVEGLSAARTS
jgi:prolyl-tRNA editing enzyme YbaK/EbsC (Cys-tRNA(Pro) deacylase)